MFVPLLVLDGLLAVALVVLLVRWSRARGRAATAEARLGELENRVGQALDAVRRADALADSLGAPVPADGRPDTPADRRPRRRVRRVAPPATPDRP